MSFSYFLLPLIGTQIDERYSLLTSHQIINYPWNIENNDYFKFTDKQLCTISQIVNILFIQMNFYVEDYYYYFSSDSDKLDLSIFSSTSHAKTFGELYELINAKYDHFLFHTVKSEILNLKEYLLDQAENEKAEKRSDVSTLQEYKKKIIFSQNNGNVNHIHNIINRAIYDQKNDTTSLPYALTETNTYEQNREIIESMCLRYHRFMSNILPYYYEEGYARSIFSDEAFLQWKKEKNNDEYIYKPQFIIDTELRRLVPGLNWNEYKKHIILSKYKTQIWEAYQRMQVNEKM